MTDIKPQQQPAPGRESEMVPEPESDVRGYRASGKLRQKVALITGGDSGIGRAVAIAFAKEGADISFSYLNEEGDARETRMLVEAEEKSCLSIAGDIRDEGFCRSLVTDTVDHYGKIDILVNNAATQKSQPSLEDISTEQLEDTFRTNILSMFFVTKEALKSMASGAAIINSASVAAYRGSAHLIDYASTKGAIVSFTRSLATSLIDRGIRVNAVAPGKVWTPLIPSGFSSEEVRDFGEDEPMGRAAQPDEIAPSYVFLASEQDSSYMTGQVLHPNGGNIINI